MDDKQNMAIDDGVYSNFSGVILYGETEGIVENAEVVELISGKVNITDGTWVNGFLKGKFVRGIFLKGKFVGEFCDGVWRNGMFGRKNKYSVFVNSRWFNGTWVNGTFALSVWVNGEWLGGDWHGNNIWVKGMWRGKWMERESALGSDEEQQEKIFLI